MKRMQKFLAASVVLGFSVVSIDAMACGVFQRQSQSNCGKMGTTSTGTVLVPTKGGQVVQGDFPQQQQQQAQWSKPSQNWIGQQAQQPVQVTTTPVVQSQTPVVVTPVVQSPVQGQVVGKIPTQSPVQQSVIGNPCDPCQKQSQGRRHGRTGTIFNPGTNGNQSYQPYQPYQPTTTAQPVNSGYPQSQYPTYPGTTTTYPNQPTSTYPTTTTNTGVPHM